MPSLKRQDKQETRVDKISCCKTTLQNNCYKATNGRLKSTERFSRGSEQDVTNAPLVCDLSDRQSRSGANTGSRSWLKATKSNVFVPVVNKKEEPLMPTTPARARKWIKSKKATPFFKKGMFCVRLNARPSNNKKQEICVGIDPGSKREAFTIKSQCHTFLNVLTGTPDWVKKAIKTRREMRRTRRSRKTPCRSPRFNRSRGGLVPSTKARWQWKLRILDWLRKMFPITHVIVEDIKVRTMGKKRWDKSFSPLEVGKHWFYEEIKKDWELTTKQGWETKELRDNSNLKKSSSKLKDTFDCHNVDSWVLANEIVGGHLKPDNVSVVKIVPLQFYRRRLHVLQPSKEGKRKNHGGTRSLGFKRGSLVKHDKHDLCFVGGSMKGKLSLHSFETGKRLCQNACVSETKLLAFNSWRLQFLPSLKGGDSLQKID